jgi:cobalt-zinc-cadmium efflux system protein
MLAIAAVGLVVNLFVALVLHTEDRRDLNIRSAFLHVLSDALSSVGVIAGGFLILRTGWTWVDPLVSVLIAVVILSSAGRVLKPAIHILNEGAPEDVDVSDVAAAMGTMGGVAQVHDLHVWTVAPGYHVLSAHVVVSDRTLSQARTLMEELKRLLSDRFGLEHTTIQMECRDCGQGRR